MNDESIIELYWQRSEDAVKETENKYGRYLFSISKNIVSDIEDCKECVNDTYLKAWETMPPNRPSRLSLYLGRITRNISIDRYRRKNSKKRKPSEYILALDELNGCEPSRDYIDERIDQIHLTHIIEEFLMKLPEETRNIFVGRYYYMDSIKDIARNTKISEANIKVKLYRVRKELKEFLETQKGVEV